MSEANVEPSLQGSDRSLFSVRDMARAMDVSESTCKRWCDRGLIQVLRTAGGHRRVTRAAIVKFSLEHKIAIVHPEVLALSNVLASVPGLTVVDQLVDQLTCGHEPEVRDIIVGGYIRGTSLTAICDDLIAPAMHKIGDLWGDDSIDIYQERRSCDLVEESLQEIGHLIGSVDRGLPLAVGGTLEHDGSRLATRMIELVLRTVGWNAHSIGAKLPAPSIAASIRDLQPGLAWVSISHPGDLHTICESLRLISDAMPTGACLLVGGAGINERIEHAVRDVSFGHSMRHLVALAIEHQKVTQARFLAP
jgi:methanogenic corrinoid protein MtbC1